MVKGPIKDIFYIHNAILKEAQEFEEVVRELNREDDAQVTGLLDRFRFYKAVLHVHEQDEEKDFFPLLEEKFRYMMPTYVFDHQHHSRIQDEIEGLLTGLRQARGNSERAQLARHLNRQAIALNVLMESHINKENELWVPVLDEQFSFEQQKEIIDRSMQSASPETMQVMMQALPWMFRAQTVDDREGMLRGFQQMMPPDMFSGVAQLLSGAVSPQDWQEMVRRMPELR